MGFCYIFFTGGKQNHNTHVPQLCHSVPCPVLRSLQAHTDQQPCTEPPAVSCASGPWWGGWGQVEGRVPARVGEQTPSMSVSDLGSGVSLGLSRQLDGRHLWLTCPITLISASHTSSSSSSSSIHSPEGPCIRISLWCHHVRLPEFTENSN